MQILLKRNRGWLGWQLCRKLFLQVCIHMHISSVGLIHTACACVCGGPKLTSRVSIILRSICWAKIPHWIKILQILVIRLASLPGHLLPLTSEFWNSKQLPQLLSFSCGFCRSRRCPYTWEADVWSTEPFLKPKQLFFFLSQISCET